MKNIHLYLFILLITIGAISCQKEAPGTEVIVTGLIEAPVSNTLNFLVGQELFTTELNGRGEFIDTLNIDKECYLRFGLGQNSGQFYAEPGDSIHIYFNLRDFENSLSFSGDNAEASNFLAAKKIRQIEEQQTFDVVEWYSAEEEVFIEQCDNRLIEENNILESYKELPSKFLAFEKEDLEYSRLMSLNSYEEAHIYFTKKTDFETSDLIKSQLANINFDDEWKFNNLFNYQNLVRNAIAAGLRKDEQVPEYLAKIENLKSQDIKNSLVRMCSSLISPSNEHLDEMVSTFLKSSNDEELNSEIQTKYDSVRLLAKGKPSPSFEYSNTSDQKVSSESLKGKLVYIDVWATWCGPCKREIPYLKEVEEKYADKGVEFVSISIDQQKDKEKWKNFVSANSLKGTQLIADSDWNSPFVKSYGITGIPRFLLIDQEGNIINADAPRPSDPRLIELFDEYAG